MSGGTEVVSGAPTGRWGEVFAVVGTALAFQVAVHLDLHAAFVLAASLAWIGYVCARLRADPCRLERWGFGTRHLRGAVAATTAFALVALAALAVFAASRGRLEVRPALLPTLLLYPIWGLVQQTLVQVFVARNLRRSTSLASRSPVVVLVCAILFALVHVPDVLLVAATAVMGAVFTSVYLRWPNLWPLGLWHGWLGAFFYAWCLDRYPLVEMLS